MTDTKPGFQPGHSGNPAGRPKGSLSRATQVLEAIFDREAEAITRKAIEMALEGDPAVMRMCLDRLVPPRRDRPVTFVLPPIDSAADITVASRALLEAVAAGDLTTSEAADIGKSLDVHARAIEIHDHGQRLATIEAKLLQATRA
jgi:hypothetical protein